MTRNHYNPGRVILSIIQNSTIIVSRFKTKLGKYFKSDRKLTDNGWYNNFYDENE